MAGEGVVEEVGSDLYEKLACALAFLCLSATRRRRDFSAIALR